MQQAYTRMKNKNKFLFNTLFVLKSAAVALLGHRRTQYYACHFSVSVSSEEI